MLNFITLCDGYKLDHRRQYPPGTQYVYSNFTPRSTRRTGCDSIVFFGLQYFLQRYLGEVANETFFGRHPDDVCHQYQQLIDGYLGPTEIGVEHIRALHQLGYIPLKFNALPEGTHVPLRMPMFTFENTHPDFFWVTNYIETLLSSVMWLPCTSATTAYRYRELLTRYALQTGGDPAFVDWQGHDFSFRGHTSPESAAVSGAAHLLSFTGTDTIPAIELLAKYYGGTGLIGGSVAATEHSVMSAGGKADEGETFERLMKLYPSGILSVVSDTWDLWNVIDNILPKYKDQILARNGKLVIRPDSGVPEDILCGDMKAPPGSSQYKGVVQRLYEIFGGTVNEKGFKVLDSHIGTIYGDSISEDRCRTICTRLRENKFCSTNVVLGIGSYTYQHVTRDTDGFAVKATWAMVNGVERMLFKDPKTDDGAKKSAIGRIGVYSGPKGLVMFDGYNLKDQARYEDTDLLQPVWEDGYFLRPTTLAEVRARVQLGPIGVLH